MYITHDRNVQTTNRIMENIFIYQKASKTIYIYTRTFKSDTKAQTYTVVLKRPNENYKLNFLQSTLGFLNFEHEWQKLCQEHSIQLYKGNKKKVIQNNFCDLLP